MSEILEKIMENELKINQDRLNLALEATGAGLWDWNISSGVSYLSPRWYAMLGYEPNEIALPRKNWKYLVHPDDFPKAIKKMQEHFDFKTELYEAEFRMKAKNGSWVWILSKGKVFERDINGKPTRMVGTHLDITERKEAEENLRYMEEHLRRFQRVESIGILARGIAHDINNILFPIIGHTEMVINKLPEDHSAQKNLQSIIKAANRAKDVIRQILVFGSNNNDCLKPIKIQSIITETISLLKASISPIIEVRCSIDKNCSSILASINHIQQIFMNLCTNACQSMAEKGGMLEITLKEVNLSDNDESVNCPNVKAGLYLQLTVKDTGSGMDEKTIEHIFDPYFTTKSISVGTGLGLFVVYGIVQKYEGYIDVKSKIGKGSAFNIYIPVLQEEIIQEVPQQSTSIEKNLRGAENILVVDDEDIVLEVIKQILEQLGYNVTGLSDSLEALELFKKSSTKFDLVIVDMVMPNMNGLELSKQILSINPDISIIMCTGYSASIIKDKIKEAGIKYLMIKPISQRDLAKTVKEVLLKDKNL